MFRSLAFVVFTSLPTFTLAQLTPEEAVKRMTLPEGFSVKCVAHEPMIRQPLSMSFDDRGRLWVLQYIQYPIPAGLKPVKQDQYLRTVWDKVLEPPPKGPKGADKITILSDPDENGVYTKSKDFLTGLNLASGFCLGSGGVYVLQSPYLLFYPDKNGDDIPDGDPEVLLTGFGLDDTHSVANSLQWGPDGWLYGAAGSTSTSKIKNPAWRAGSVSDRSPELIEFQQGIWRYQPHTKRFELFSEGGGNTFGLDFDKHGQCIAGTNFGGVAMLHHMQGAYYVKGFSKHGPLHNPHAYGYFEHVPYKNFQGGHVTCGGILYEADQYPEQYRGHYIAANLLSNQIHWHKMTPKGASFTAEHGGILLDAHDTWFRPVDCLLGPDGCVYIADWYDKRAAHLDPIDNWDKTNGRIYKIEYTGKTPGADATRLEKPVEPGRVSARSFDLRKKKPAELVELLKHPNMWWRKEARRILGEKYGGNEIAKLLESLVEEGKPEIALEALWALAVRGKVNEDILRKAVQRPFPELQAWVVRLACDEPEAANLVTVFQAIQDQSQHPDPRVLAEVLCGIRRMSVSVGIRAIWRIHQIRNFPDDAALPLLYWWAVETHSNGREVKKLQEVFLNPEGQVFPLSPHIAFVLERLIRRITVVNTAEAADLVAKYLPTIPDVIQRSTILQGFESGATSITHGASSAGLIDAIKQVRPKLLADQATRLLVRLGDADEIQKILKQIGSPSEKPIERIQGLQLFAKTQHKAILPIAISIINATEPDNVKLAAVNAIENYDDPKSSEQLITAYPTATAPVKKRLLQALLSRPTWAIVLFQAYDAGTFPKADLTPDHARTAAALNDPALTKLVEKHFGKVAPVTPGEKIARINSLAAMLKREKPGDAAAGKAVFTKNCAACHQLHGEGAKVGPDLTTADRKNRGYMLTQIVDPSGYIRPEYLNFTINTHDGRTLLGMVAEQTPEAVTLATWLNGKIEKTAMRKGDIDTMVPSPVSMMPEKLLDGMSEVEVRDLFAYLESAPASRERERPESNDNPKPPVAHAPGSPKPKYKVALISGSLEYKSDESLPILQKLLEENYPVECVRMFRKADDDIPGLEKLKDCDLAIFFTRRLTLDGEQLKMVKAYCDSGKPILGIRTASHGFQKWLEMDKDVYGGDYKNHYKAGTKCDVTINVKNEEHVVLKGVSPYESSASLYRNAKPAEDVTILMYGAIPDNKEPITWVRERKVNEKAQRVFYTSLGHPDDFKEKSFMKLLTNAVGWCVKDDSFAK